MFASALRRGRFPNSVLLCVVLVATSCGLALGAEPSRFTPSKYKSGELRLIEGIPVVTVAGTPQEIGEQLGNLLKQPLAELFGKKDEIAHGLGLEHAPNLLVKTSRIVTPAFPQAYRQELEAISKATGLDLDTLAFGNIVYEISRFPACSSLAVEPARSSVDGPLFGRNLDFPTFGFLDKFSVVVVERPEGKHAFASITFPGMTGVFSGMNDAGLCVAQLEVNSSADGSPRVDLFGTPVAMCFRRLLEECTTVDEAEKLLREQKRMMMCNLAVCDRNQSAVLEVTPRAVARRSAESGLCPCTNHFRTKELAVDKQCWRYDKLMQSDRFERLGISDVAKLLDSANQGRFTMQTMIFEPATLRLHVSFGPLPSSSQPLKPINLADLLTLKAE
jgi:predicted choloylglycine hydrolase